MKRNTKIRNTSIVLVFLLGFFIIAAKDSTKSAEPAQAGRFRFPASHLFGELRSGSVAVEKKYAAQLALRTDKKRKLASLGRPASPLESLRFGILEGKYALTMDGDRIQDLSFVDTPQSDGSPTAIGNRSEFLNKFAVLFGLTGSPQRVSVDVKGHQIVEIYKAPANGNDMILKVVLDSSDRLINLHSEPDTVAAAGRKIF